MMEFYDPILALCNDRTKTAKKNPTIDEPQSYLNNNLRTYAKSIKFCESG